MKVQLYKYWLFITTVLLFSGCDNRQKLELEDVGGDVFPFHSPVTTLKDYMDTSSLVIGTKRGVASFDTKNGIFRELRNVDSLIESSGDIYDILVDANSIFYSVRDGGIRRIDAWNDTLPGLFEIEIKKTQYSAYQLFRPQPQNNEEYLIAGTSNGIYRWPISIKKSGSTTSTTIIRDSAAAPMRFYSIAPHDTSSFMAAGENGVFYYDRNEDTLRLLRKENVLALHSNFKLLKDGSLIPEDGGTDKAVITFSLAPRNFVVDKRDKSYIYAISVSAVEVAELTTIENGTTEGKIIYTIKLPEKHLTRPRNTSSRQIGLIKNNHLFVAPGGNCIYRIPLAPYKFSDEVISLCPGKHRQEREELYVLTAKHDLYLMTSAIKGKDKLRIKYLRSFEHGEQIQLLGCSGNWLIVSKNNIPYGLYGRRKNLITRPLPPEDDFSNADKITCNLWDKDTLFQGRSGLVKRFSYSLSPFGHRPALRDSISFQKREGDDWGEDTGPDYYPTHLARLNDKYLIVGTLHSGVVYKDVTDSSSLFKSLLEYAGHSKVLDIKTFENAVYVLDNNRIYRFSFNKNKKIFDPTTNFDLQDYKIKPNLFNRILPDSTSKFFLFCNDYDFQKGFASMKGFASIEITSDEKLKVNYKNESETINDAISSPANITYLGGSGGIILSSSPTEAIPFSVGQIHRVFAKFWPYDLFFTIILLISISYLSFRRRLGDYFKLRSIENAFKQARNATGCYDVLLKAKATKVRTVQGHRNMTSLIRTIEAATVEMKKSLAEETRQRYRDKYRPGGYVLTLFETLVAISTPADLKSNIEQFEKEENIRDGSGHVCHRLSLLDEIGQILDDVHAIAYPKCNCLTKNRELVNESLIMLKKYQQKYQCKLGNSAAERMENPIFLSWKDVSDYDNEILKEGPGHKMDDLKGEAGARMRKIRNLEGKCGLVSSYRRIYRELSANFLEKYDSQCKLFLESFCREDGIDAEYKDLFRTPQYEKKDAKFKKQLFMMFPVHAADPVGEVLFLGKKGQFSSRKSEWKGAVEVKAFPVEYRGLIGLILKAGLSRIEEVAKNRKKYIQKF